MFEWFHNLFGPRFEKRRLIRDLEVGKLQCVIGDAAPITNPISAPFTGIPSVTITVVQQRLVDDSGSAFGRRNRTWSTVNDVDFGQKFYVVDESGMIRVDRKGWSVLRAVHTNARTVRRAERLERLDRFRALHHSDLALGELEKYDLEGTDSDFRCYETYVDVGARVRVQGVVRETGEVAPDNMGGSFREARRLLELVPPDQTKLIIDRLKKV